MNFSLTVIDSFDAWKTLAGPWNELLGRSASNTVFLTWEWLFSWAECYLQGQRKLFIIVLYKDQELVGIAPWYIDHSRYMLLPMRRIEFLGSPEAGSDYLDVIAKRGKEQEVACDLYQFLMVAGQSCWDCLQLREIPAASPFLLHFLNKIETDGKYVEVRHGSYCPIALLPESNDEYLATLSSNRREQFRRHSRRLNDRPDMEHLSAAAREGDRALTDWHTFFKEKNQYFNEPLDRFIKTFAARCTDKDWLQIDLLKAGGRSVAGLLHLCYQDELSMYLMTVDKDFEPRLSIGNILVGRALQKAIEQGLKTYDFLKGTEDYKFHWANDGRRSLNLYFCTKRLAPFLFTLERFLKNTAKTVLR